MLTRPARNEANKNIQTNVQMSKGHTQGPRWKVQK